MLTFDAIVDVDEPERASVVVTGDLCAQTELLLVGAAVAAMDNAAVSEFSLDLRGVTRIDAAGAQAVLDIQRDVLRRGFAFEVLGAPSEVEEVLGSYDAGQALAS